MDRLFVAIDLPVEIKRDFVVILDELRSANGKTVPIENIHLTVKFIGETNKTKDIINTLSAIRFRSFSLSVEGVGLFGSVYHPKVFWVGVVKNESLESLFLVLEEELSKVGIAKENREFSPHITLARFKAKPDIRRLESVLKTYGSRKFGSFDVKGVTLYKSELAHPNPKYFPLKFFQLEGA
ncbi:MAG: RNA 2',3'-cyclic phosphodiesterase [Brevinematia bacterium]